MRSLAYWQCEGRRTAKARHSTIDHSKSGKELPFQLLAIETRAVLHVLRHGGKDCSRANRYHHLLLHSSHTYTTLILSSKQNLIINRCTVLMTTFELSTICFRFALNFSQPKMNDSLIIMIFMHIIRTRSLVSSLNTCIFVYSGIMDK